MKSTKLAALIWTLFVGSPFLFAQPSLADAASAYPDRPGQSK
jgi:hypothetical protein